MPAGKSPNNAFNLHKERMKGVFNILKGGINHDEIAIRFEEIIKSLQLNVQWSVGPGYFWWWRVQVIMLALNEKELNIFDKARYRELETYMDRPDCELSDCIIVAMPTTDQWMQYV